MADQGMENELETFFKALADANRLKIVGLLARGPMSVEQIAKSLNISSSTASHHLSRLSKAGLVSAKAEGYYSIYRLEEKTLEDMSKRLMPKENPPAAAAEEDVDAFDKKVLTTFLDVDGSIKEIPMQGKKLDVILRYMMKSFEPGRRYTEKEVNEIIKRFNKDVSGLRRDLIETRYLARERDGSAYWVAEQPEKP